MKTLSPVKTVSKKPLVISYMRFSRPEQSEGDSLRRQSEGAERYCRDQNLTLTDRLEDKGISGFRGANRSASLSDFLDLVQQGNVPAGSTLIVEDLDRLSRQVPEEALELFLAIVRAGVTIVTLIDGNEFRKGQLDMVKLMGSVMKICLAHQESAKKSGRLADAWSQKRKEISKGKIYTSLLPNWLCVRDGKIALVESVAAKVSQMFDLVLEGFGTTKIAKKTGCQRSYVSKCLHNRQVVGEFQPHKLIYSESGKRKREPYGEPIKGYYIPIVDVKKYDRVQRMMALRRRDTGPSTSFVNLFKGLMFNTDDGSQMVIVNKGSSVDHRQYVSSLALNHKEGAAPYVAIPTDVLEKSILEGLALGRNIHPTETAPIESELADVENKFAETASQIGKLGAALLTAGNVVTLVEALKKLEAEKADLELRRRGLQIELEDANSSATHDAHRYIAANRFVGDDDGRTKLRTAIRQHVRRIDLSVTKKGHTRTFRWEITFSEGLKFSHAESFHVRDPERVELEAQARELWRQAVRPKEITERTGISTTHLYLICADVKREGAWKPKNRWDGHRKKK